MAVLAKIRQRSLFLIIVIALALFSFVLADLIQSGGFGRDANNVGSVNGEDISYQDFRVMVDNVNKSMGGNNSSSIFAVNYVWNQQVREKIVNNLTDNLGLSLSPEQLLERLKQDPSIGQNQLFLNENGEFDETKLTQFLASEMASNSAQWNGWKKYEQQVEQKELEKMYFNLISSGIRATSNEGKLKYKLDNDKVSFQYVVYPFSTIADTTITVSDQEITAYINKHKDDYEAEASRDIKFIFVEEKPSAADIEAVNQRIQKIMNGHEVFEEGKTIAKPAFKDVPAEHIAEFVNTNSDIKFDSSYVAKDKLPAAHQEQLFNLSKDTVYGPYELDGYSYITRKLNQKEGGQVKSSHILVSYVGAQNAKPEITRTKEEAKAKAEELLAKVKKDPSSFTTTAVTESDGPSASKGGDLGFAAPGAMVPPYDKFIFNNAVGTLGVVETDFGFHVVKVTDKQQAVQLATIGLRIETSEETSNQLFNDISNFEMKANEGAFDTIAKQMNYDVKEAKKLKNLDETLPDVGNQREIVRWAFNEETDLNDIKKFNLPKGYIIAQLTNITEEGLQSAEDAKDKVKPLIIKEKKTTQAKALMIGDFEALKKVEGVKTGTATNVSVASPYIPSGGREPKVVAHALALEKDKTSSIIDGDSGIYMIKVITKEEAIDLPDYTSYTNKIKNERGNITESLYKTLEKKADITDNRHLFY